MSFKAAACFFAVASSRQKPRMDLEMAFCFATNSRKYFPHVVKALFVKLCYKRIQTIQVSLPGKLDLAVLNICRLDVAYIRKNLVLKLIPCWNAVCYYTRSIYSSSCFFIESSTPAYLVIDLHDLPEIHARRGQASHHQDFKMSGAYSLQRLPSWWPLL